MVSAMPKLWLAPKVWLHGSQSSRTGGAQSRNGNAWASIAWLAQIMRWVLITAFGRPVEPDVSRNLAIVSGPTAARARSSFDAGPRGEEVGEREPIDRVGGACGDARNPGRDDGVERARKGGAVGGVDEAGRQQVKGELEPGEILRGERVGRRDRAIGHADLHRRQADQGVLDVVARQHDDRPLGAEIELEQRRGDARDRVERLGVGELAPGAVGVALGEEDAVGRLARPAAQAVAEPARIGGQRFGRTDEERTVGAGDETRGQRRRARKADSPSGADRPHRVLPLFGPPLRAITARSTDSYSI